MPRDLSFARGARCKMPPRRHENAALHNEINSSMRSFHKLNLVYVALVAIGALAAGFGSALPVYAHTPEEIAVRQAVEDLVLEFHIDEDLFERINSQNEATGHHTFVLDAQTLEMVAEEEYPRMVGLPAVFLHDADKSLSRIMSELGRADGAWVEYPFHDPQTGMQQVKRSYLVMHDGYIFGAGYYLLPEEGTMREVQDIIDDYDTYGIGLLADASYVWPEHSFVLNASSMEVVAHDSAEMMGNSIHDVMDGYWPSEFVADQLYRNGGVWASYQSSDARGDIQHVRAWLQLHDGYVFASGYPITLEYRVFSVVDEAMGLYESQGKRSFDALNSMMSDAIHRPTVYDIFDKAVVSDGAFPDRVGQPLGTFFREVPGDIIHEEALGRAGLWTEYLESDPRTGEERRILVWSVVNEDGYVFQSGYMYSPEDEVLHAVDDAVRLYDSDPDTAFDRITWQSVNPSVIYPFVINGTTYQTLAHASTPEFVGVCCSDAIRETGDRPFEDVLEDVRQDGGAWVDYVFNNPATGTDQLKRTWLFAHDGHIFGSGYYNTEYIKTHETLAEALALYESEGEAYFEQVNQMESDDAIYPFVLDADTLEVVAEGAYPIVVGLPAVFLHDAGMSLEDILDELNGGESVWVEYPFQNPETEIESAKRSMLALRDGYIFGAGYHQSPDNDAQGVVRDVIRLYDAVGEDSLLGIGDYKTDVSVPFVLDAEDMETVAHGAGTVRGKLIQETIMKTWQADLLDNQLEDRDGIWLSYLSTNPETGEQASKRAWLQMHDGYVVGAGYEVSAEAKATHVVGETIDLYEYHGADSLNVINDATGGDHTHTPTVYSVSPSRLVAYPSFPAWVGHSLDFDRLIDRPFHYILDKLAAADGIWLEGSCAEDRRCIFYFWWELHDGHIFASRYAHLSEAAVKDTVSESIEMYKSDPATAFDRILWKSVRITQTYPFVLNATDFSTVAHGAIPERQGDCCSDDIRDTGDKSFEQILEELEAGDGTWVQYEFYNPDTEKVEPKRTWLSLYDGYIFGSGYYYADRSGIFTTLENAIERYDLEGVESFDAVNSMMAVDDQHYLFVLDARTLKVVAHGADPGLVGTDFDEKRQGLGYPIEYIMDELLEHGSVWSGAYTSVNPETGEEESKNSLLWLHGGYIFGSGYYFTDSVQ